MHQIRCNMIWVQGITITKIICASNLWEDNQIKIKDNLSETNLTRIWTEKKFHMEPTMMEETSTDNDMMIGTKWINIIKIEDICTTTDMTAKTILHSEDTIAWRNNLICRNFLQINGLIAMVMKSGFIMSILKWLQTRLLTSSDTVEKFLNGTSREKIQVNRTMEDIEDMASFISKQRKDNRMLLEWGMTHLWLEQDRLWLEWITINLDLWISMGTQWILIIKISNTEIICKDDTPKMKISSIIRGVQIWETMVNKNKIWISIKITTMKIIMMIEISIISIIKDKIIIIQTSKNVNVFIL